MTASPQSHCGLDAGERAGSAGATVKRPEKSRNEALFREEFRAQKTVVTCRPLFLQIETTSRCNFKCRICERTYQDFKGGDLIDARLLDRLEEQLFPTLLDSSIQGFGEPLLDPRFDEVLDRMARHGVHTGFTTNGSLLTPERLDKYIRLGVFLAVSIDGATSETYRKLRPHGDFERLVDILSTVPELKRRYSESGAHLRIHFVATTENIDDLPAMVDLAERLGADDIEVINLLAVRLPPDVARLELANDPARANRRFREAAARAESSPVKLRLPPLFDTSEGGADRDAAQPFDPSQARNYVLWPKLETSRSPYPNSCCEPWSRLVVAANGDVRPCCVWPYAVGNLIEQDFEEVWNGPQMRKLRGRINSRFPQLPCKECTLWYGLNAGRKETVQAGLPQSCRAHTQLQRWARRLKNRR